MRGKNNQPMAVFSLFTAPEHTRLTKALSLDDDGNLVKTAPQNAGSEWIETVRMQLSELPAFMASLGTNQCLVHGEVRDNLADNGPVRVVTMERRKNGDGKRRNPHDHLGGHKQLAAVEPIGEQPADRR